MPRTRTAPPTSARQGAVPPKTVSQGTVARSGLVAALLAYRNPAITPDVERAARQSIAMLYVVLPFPPTTNHLYATVNGHRVKSAEGRAYEQACALAVRDATAPDPDYPDDPLPLPPFTLVLHLWVPDQRRRDLDGCLKAPIDNVFRAIGHDDSTVMEIHAYKALDRKRPRLEMIVSQWRKQEF